ncbi:hypothetical protein [Kushneria indalinina]|uniref:Uncharacterized protein n=1 Tax=Kushneria indalinina DSM 14324 TaxID=1122140 RepID=A0A3D9DRJ6_9GAMM|nr:hypothetical protein [Kushneria indalinina]REC93337.1 hypothetical protein C8D72_3496 [Kushneria indalinina DSM 14324]
MNTQKQDEHLNESSDFFERNDRWLKPAMATFVVIAVPLLLKAFEDMEDSAIPPWIDTLTLAAYVAAGVGAVLTGIMLMLTDTTTARVVVSGLEAVVLFGAALWISGNLFIAFGIGLAGCIAINGLKQFKKR